MILVIDYGIGNLRSAEKALLAVGAEARLVSQPDQVGRAEGVVIPGVGAFGAAMESFRRSGFEGPVRDLISEGVPTLGICVGMQMLYQGSDESVGVPGLGMIPGMVRRLDEGVRLPQMQWNRLGLLDGADLRLFQGLSSEDFVYFVHSYAAPISEVTTSVCDYGGSFSASVSQGNLFGVQFHPEKSSRVGLKVLDNFRQICVERSGERWR